MYNTKFILADGKELYPGYLEPEFRKKLKEQYKDARGYMRCGCKPEANLYYRISEDLRIYPEHNNYQHSPYCCRYKDSSDEDSRQTAYMVKDEDGSVVAFTSFDPKNFSLTEETEKEEDNEVPDELEEEMEEVLIEIDTSEDEEAKEKKAPTLNLSGLVRCINVDCFTEKMLNDRKIESKDKFSVYVFHRMKKISLSRAKKTLGELSLEKDGCRFIYLPFDSIIQHTENGMTKCYIQTRGVDGKLYKNFIYPKLLDRELKRFKKTYLTEPDENTYVAGFQYLVKNRAQISYKVIGRLNMFKVSKIGLYCKSNKEMRAYNYLHDLMDRDSNIRFWVPPEDENIGAIIEKKGCAKKILLIFSTKKSERITYDASLYVPLVIQGRTELSDDMIYNNFE